ncbi:unnamed protein product, partial [Arabidopsis halleri]
RLSPARFRNRGWSLLGLLGRWLATVEILYRLWSPQAFFHMLRSSRCRLLPTRRNRFSPVGFHDHWLFFLGIHGRWFVSDEVLPPL